MRAKGTIARQWARFLKPIDTRTLITVQWILNVLCNDSVVVTRYGLDDPGIESWWRWDFSHPSRLVLGTSSPMYNWYWVFYRGWNGRGAALTSHPFLLLRLKEEYVYNSTILWAFKTCSRVKFTCTLCGGFLNVIWHGYCYCLSSTSIHDMCLLFQSLSN